MTKRQKSRLDEVYSADLMELPDDFGSTKAKASSLSAAEAALKREEMLRRRKNQTEQRLQEEKMETINKLLKKQASKTHRRSGRLGAANESTPMEGDGANGEAVDVTPKEPEIPLMVRWVSNKDGERLAVPDSWLEGPIGAIYQKQVEPEVKSRKRGHGLIEEIPDPMDTTAA